MPEYLIVYFSREHGMYDVSKFEKVDDVNREIRAINEGGGYNGRVYVCKILETDHVNLLETDNVKEITE